MYHVGMLKLDITLIEGLAEQQVFELRDRDGKPAAMQGLTWAAYYKAAGAAEAEQLKAEAGETASEVVVHFPARSAGGGKWWLDFYDSTGDCSQMLHGEVVVLSSLPNREAYEAGTETRSYRVQLADDGTVLAVRALPCTGAELVYRKAVTELEHAATDAKQELAGTVDGYKEEVRELATEVKQEIVDTLGVRHEQISDMLEIREENVIYYIYQPKYDSWGRYMLIGGQVIYLDAQAPPAGEITNTGLLKVGGVKYNPDMCGLVEAIYQDGTIQHGVMAATATQAGTVKLSGDFLKHTKEDGLVVMRGDQDHAGVVKVSFGKTEALPNPIDPSESATVPSLYKAQDIAQEQVEAAMPTIVSEVQREMDLPLQNLANKLHNVELVTASGCVTQRGRNFRVWGDGYVEVWGMIKSTEAGGYNFYTRDVAPGVAFYRTEGTELEYFSPDLDVQVTLCRGNKLSYDSNWYGWAAFARIESNDHSAFVTVYMPKNAQCYVRVCGYMLGTELS